MTAKLKRDLHWFIWWFLFILYGSSVLIRIVGWYSWENENDNPTIQFLSCCSAVLLFCCCSHEGCSTEVGEFEKLVVVDTPYLPTASHIRTVSWEKWKFPCWGMGTGTIAGICCFWRCNFWNLIVELRK